MAVARLESTLSIPAFAKSEVAAANTAYNIAKISHFLLFLFSPF